MTMNELVLVISVFCGFKDERLTKEQKLECAEYMVNCSVDKNGSAEKELFDKCQTKWIMEKKKHGN